MYNKYYKCIFFATKEALLSISSEMANTQSICTVFKGIVGVVQRSEAPLPIFFYRVRCWIKKTVQKYVSFLFCLFDWACFLLLYYYCAKKLVYYNLFWTYNSALSLKHASPRGSAFGLVCRHKYLFSFFHACSPTQTGRKNAGARAALSLRRENVLAAPLH